MSNRQKINWTVEPKYKQKAKGIPRKRPNKIAKFTTPKNLDPTTVPVVTSQKDVRRKMHNLHSKCLIGKPGRTLSYDDDKTIIITKVNLTLTNTNSSQKESVVQTTYDAECRNPTPDMLVGYFKYVDEHVVEIDEGTMIFLTPPTRVFIRENNQVTSLMMHKIIVNGIQYMISEAMIASLFGENRIEIH